MKQICFLSLFFFLVFNFYDSVLAADLFISKYPETPKEGEEVTLTLESSTYNLNKANIEWSVNGKIVDSGVGRKTLTERTPLGGSKVVRVNITEEGQESINAETTIIANTSYIFYEGADSYVPAFYKGRRLPAQEGLVRAAVFEIDNGNVSKNNSGKNYSWKINGQDSKESSGFGKTLNTLKGNIIDKSLSLKIKIEPDGLLAKLTDVFILLQKVEAIIYKTDEKNLVQNAVGQTENGREMYMSVEPYFFSVQNKRDNYLTYSWKINDNPVNITSPWFLKLSNKEKEITRIVLNIFQKNKLTQENDVGFTFKSN